MRITAILERPVRLHGGPQGGPANALVNFTGHTVSLVALIADRDGRPVVGVAFDAAGKLVVATRQAIYGETPDGNIQKAYDSPDAQIAGEVVPRPSGDDQQRGRAAHQLFGHRANRAVPSGDTDE